MARGNELIAKYFDGVLCPVCRGHTLRERNFETIENSRKGVYTANISYCGRLIIVGMILQGRAGDYLSDRPEEFFYKQSNFWCPECLGEADSQDQFQYRYSPPGETWVDFSCPCGFVTVIRVLPRRVGVDFPPQVLPPDDRSPEIAEVMGVIRIEELAFIHRNDQLMDQFVRSLHTGYKRGQSGKVPQEPLALPERTSK